MKGNRPGEDVAASNPGQPAPRRTRGVSKNPDEARRKILASAIHLFGRLGFKSTSTEQIAEHAGYGQATVFFHFKTKAGLLKACLENALEKAKVSIPAVEAIGTLALVEKLDDAFDDNPTAEFFNRILLEQNSSSIIRPIYADFHAHVRNMIRDEIVRDSGVALERATDTAAAILSMMIGVHAEYRVENVRFSRADYRTMLMQVTSLLLAHVRR